MNLVRAPSDQAWKRNLATLWVAEFVALVGFSLATPFLPIFIAHDLGVSDPAALARWTGAVAGVAGISMAVASPIWGVLADRYGRKPMLVRALLGGAVTVGLMGAVNSPQQLVGLRLIQGASSGTVGAATALVAAETPRARIGWALGILGSSVALGSALGPLIGSLGALIAGYRAVFVAAGILCLAALPPVLFLVHESPQAPRVAKAVAPGRLLRTLPRSTLLALVVLVGSQSLMAVSQAAVQQLAVLKLLGLAGAAAGTYTGIAFGAGGVVTALASVAAGSMAVRWGYRWTAVIGALLMGGPEIAMATTHSAAALSASVAAFGLGFGLLGPCLSSMLGLEAPTAIQSTVFGTASSSLALGLAAGPIVGGAIAASAGVDFALAAVASSALLLAALVWALAREPLAPTLGPQPAAAERAGAPPDGPATAGASGR